MSSYIRNVVPRPSSRNQCTGVLYKKNSSVSNKQNAGKSPVQEASRLRNKVHRKTTTSTELSQQELCELEVLISKTDNSMDQIISSSIRQLELMLHPFREQSLEDENTRLRGMLEKMEHLLKDKLHQALQRQREQVAKMASDYISLITKLLRDKEEMNVRMQLLEEEKLITKMNYQECQERIQKLIKSNNEKLAEANEQIVQLRDQLLRNTEAPVSELSNKDFNKSRHSSAEKDDDKYELKQVIRLVEQYQKENNELKLQISRLRLTQGDGEKTICYDKLRQIEEIFKKELIQMQRNHSLEFEEYQNSIRDTMAKKNECIERLNFIIDDLRSRKRSNS